LKELAEKAHGAEYALWKLNAMDAQNALGAAVTIRAMYNIPVDLTSGRSYLLVDRGGFGMAEFLYL